MGKNQEVLFEVSGNYFMEIPSNTLMLFQDQMKWRKLYKDFVFSYVSLFPRE